MPIKINVVDIKEGAILHGVNCQGHMGAGIAKVLRDAYPKIYEPYRIHIQYYGLNSLGDFVEVKVTETLSIVHLFTQKTYGREIGKRYVSYDALERSLRNYLDSQVKELPSKIWIPDGIGSGLANGNKVVIHSIINTTFESRNLPFTFFDK